MIEASIRLPWPPSTNNAYATVRGRRVKTKAARDYTDRVQYALHTSPPWRRARYGLKRSHRLRVTLTAHPPDRRRRDLGNLEKLCIDSVFAWLGLDDSQIDELLLRRADLDRPDGSIILSVGALP